MKRFFIILAVLFIANFANSQKLEIQFLGGIGNSINNIKSPSTMNRVSHKEDRSLYSTPFEFNANYYLFKNLYLGTGIGFSKYNYNQIMESAEFGYILESVNFSESYISIPLNIGIEFTINKNMNFGLQYGLHYDKPISKNKTIQNSVEKQYGFIDYNYILKQKIKSNFNHQLSIYSKFSLFHDWDIVFNFGYEIRKNGVYSHELHQIIFSTDQDTQVTTSKKYSFMTSFENIDHNYINFQIGLAKTFKFNNKS